MKNNKMVPLWKDSRFYFVITLSMMIGLLIVQLIVLKIVPMKYFIPLIIILLLLLFIMWWLQYNNKINKVNRILGKFMIVILSILLTVGNLYVFKAGDMLKQITGENIETDAISVIVLKNSKAKKIDDLIDSRFGSFETPDIENINSTIAEINKKLNTNINYKAYDSYNDEAEALYDNKIDAIIVNEAYRGLFEEKYPEFDADTKVVYQHKVEKRLENFSKEVDVTTTPFNVYISGIDTYGPVSTRSRSDVNMIATINPKNKTIVLTSIPRDYYVPQTCQGGQEDKLTHTGIFGVECTVNTVENFLGVAINYYARVNFTSLVNIVDSLGGIVVENPINFTGNMGTLFSQGNISLAGQEALEFSRERYSLAEGDSDRGKNQMRVITGMVNKAISPSIITNYTSVMNAVSGSFQTNMESNDITSLIKMQLGDMSGWNIIQQQVSGTGENGVWSPANYSYSYMMYPDMDSVNEAVVAIKNNMK